MSRPQLSAERLTPYFLIVALIHAFAVATRFDLFAAKLPSAVPIALMIGQFPLIVLSGYFEGRIDYGPMPPGFPLWMRIKSKPVKIAFTFAFIYIACVTLQTLHFSIGPIDPTPPLSFPPAQRAMWFGMFTAGMFFPFYLAATSLLIPILRALTAPMRIAPGLVGGLVALAVGAGLGVVVFALVTSTKLVAFIDGVHAWVNSAPALTLGVTLGLTLGPLLIGLVLNRDD